MATTDARVERQPFWSPWGDRLVATLSVGLALCLTWWWVATNYLRQPLSLYLVFKPIDKPSPLPPSPEAVLGVHYFSDFQEGRFWGEQILHGISPYDWPNLYPPLNAWFMVPFAEMPVGLGLTIFLTLTTMALVVPCWLLLRDLPAPTRIVVTSLLALLTGPFLALIDRGNLHGLTLGAVGFGLVALQRRRVKWAVALFALAICLKPPFLIIVIVALARRRLRFAVDSALIALVVTLASAVVLPGGPINAYGMLKRQFQASGGADFSLLERIQSNVSASGLSANLEVLAHGIPRGGLLIPQGPLWTLATAVVGATIVAVIAWRHNLPQWVWITVALSMTQLAQPYSGTHTAAWATLAAVCFGAGALLPTDLVGQDDERTDRWVWALRVIILVALTVTLLPLAIRPTIAGVDVPVPQILGSALWIVVATLAVVASLVRPRVGSSTTSVT